MHGLLRIAGALLLAIGGLSVVLLAFLAVKGFFTTRGLIVVMPSRYITRVPAPTVIAIVLLIVILGLGAFVLGRRRGNSNPTRVSRNS